jgi:hypothetical protein
MEMMLKEVEAAEDDDEELTAAAHQLPGCNQATLPSQVDLHRAHASRSQVFPRKKVSHPYCLGRRWAHILLQYTYVVQ